MQDDNDVEERVKWARKVIALIYLSYFIIVGVAILLFLYYLLNT